MVPWQVLEAIAFVYFFLNLYAAMLIIFSQESEGQVRRTDAQRQKDYAYAITATIFYGLPLIVWEKLIGPTKLSETLDRLGFPKS